MGAKFFGFVKIVVHGNLTANRDPNPHFNIIFSGQRKFILLGSVLLRHIQA